MIKVRIFRNTNNEIYGFQADDHGAELVCSAVSFLVLNTVNSIENFTDEDFTCEYNEEGGFLDFELPEIKLGSHNHDANLLLNSLALGLMGMKMEYEKDIDIID